jgi:hypothetical protein
LTAQNVRKKGSASDQGRSLAASDDRAREMLPHADSDDNKDSLSKSANITHTADSGPSRTVIPTDRGQRSGDCGQFLMSV